MADICTSAISPNNCSHFNLSGSDDGVGWSLTVHDGDLLQALTSDERATLRRLLLRVLRQKGVTPSAFVNRVVRGEEATNVKQYDFLGPGNSVTKANIGTGYTNVLPGLNGERIPVDLTGVTEFRVFLTVNMVGTGPLRARIVRDSDNTVLYENTNINVAAGERELDTGWLAIPGGFTGVELLRWQMSSATATDDPVFRRCGLLVR
jgi:hypothetical protein